MNTVNYAAGRADRFAMSAALVRRVSERLFDLAGGWSPFRYSAPVVDICMREILGIMTTQVGALRADSLVDALAQLRANRTPTPPLASAPRLTGSIALLPAPVYVGTTQPEFGGWICNVRPSAQYHVHYAVYMVSHPAPALATVVDNERRHANTCGWSNRIVMLEYRSGRVPKRVCAEPSPSQARGAPLLLALDAAAEVEILRAIELDREACPGERGYLPHWQLTHDIEIRSTVESAIDQLAVELVGPNGRRATGSWSAGDLDPDVRGFAFVFERGQPTQLVVRPRDQ